MQVGRALRASHGCGGADGGGPPDRAPLCSDDGAHLRLEDASHPDSVLVLRDRLVLRELRQIESMQRLPQLEQHEAERERNPALPRIAERRVHARVRNGDDDVGDRRVLPREAGAEGVQCTALVPAFVDTPMTDFIKESVSARDMIRPQDIAEATFGRESFIRASDTTGAPLPEDDLFAGLRP